MPKSKYIFPIFLALSLAGNAYLFSVVIIWQKAWLAQIQTTSNIENIFRKSGADISFESIKSIAQKEYESTFKVLSKKEADNEAFGPYENIILVDESRLYFRNNSYAGSKANLPPNAKGVWFTP